MNRLPAVLFCTAVLVGGLAGCAGTAGTPAAAPATSASSAAPAASDTVTPPARTGSGRPAGSCAGGFSTGIVQLNERNDGATVCLGVGTRLEVYLRGADDDRWSQIIVDGNAIAPAANGKRALQLGVTAGFYAGAHAGTVHLASARDGHTWRVTVTVG